MGSSTGVNRRIKVFCVLIQIMLFYCSAMADNITHKSIQVRSTSLLQISLSDGNITRYDYVNEEGEITYAADKRYATRIEIKNDGTILEEYYDADGLPAKQKLGHYALISDYNEKNQIIKLIYLDANGQPIINYDGYAIVKRYYNNAGLLETEFYFDNFEKPITTRSFGNGCKRIYDDEGNTTTYIYLDDDSKPAKTAKGYAIIHRTYYSEGINKGRIKNEYYCDEKDQPVQLVKGQYGIYKEYDEYGRANLITYLNKNGEPVISLDGYATCKQTFYDDDTICTEAYYDEKGDPIALSEGQYGVLYQDEKIIYLDINGCELFSIKNFLHNNHLVMIALGIIAIIIPILSNKKVNIILLALYLLLIFYLTMMFRNHLDRKMELRLFWSYKQFFSNDQIQWQIIENICLFIPLGIMLYKINPNRKILFLLIAISTIIETIQYISGLGLCEIDDVISNSLGGCIGYTIGQLTSNLKMRIKKCKHTYSA